MGFELVDIQEKIPSICVGLRYASYDNVIGRILYKINRCYVLAPTAEALEKVQQDLAKIGLGLKVWDGYRPLSIQWRFWHYLPDEHYVADPRKGGRHTRGTAVDVTLVTKDKQELPMPSDFDDFTPKAHRGYMGASQEAIQNRQLLQEVMEKNGFIGLPTEWWHFDLEGWEKYPPLDVQFPIG